MKKNWIRTIATVLVLLLLATMFAGCKQSSEPKIEENTGDNRATYPYVVHTASATWYLAADDIALLGEDAFYMGLWQILKDQEADFADARKALKGYIPDAIPVVDIYTDFTGRATISEMAGAYYNPRSNFIKVFSGWEMAECTLLHEYVHYLTIHCAEQPTTLGFYAEGVAEYIAMIVCKNRMARSVNYCFSAEEIAQCKAHNAWDTAEDCIDLMKSYFSLADYYAQGVFVGFEYYSVSDVMELRTEQVQQNPTVYNVSHIEAACIMAYLVETFSRDTVFQNWGMEPDDIETVYGEPFSSLYQKWSAWNHERCAALGMN